MWPDRGSGRNERGAIIPMVAILSTLLLAVAAFAVDLGQQRVARRDLQALSDVVALDLARSLDGRAKLEYSTAELDAARNSSVARNDDHVLGHAPVVTYELGRVGVDGTFVTIAAAEVPNAVRVQAAGGVDFAFAPGSGGAQRSAVAVAEAGGCFSVGSYAARVSLGQDTFLLGPLLQILGVGADLDVLDLEGLADANIQALGLLDTDLGAATFDELVTTSVNLADFYRAVATVLERESGHTAEVDLLNSLAQLNLPDLDLTLGQILDLDTAGSSALGATLNVLDLVAASAFAANGENVLSVPALDLNVPGVSQLTAALTIGQKPIISCGRVGKARAASSQVSLELSGHLTDLNLGLVQVSSPITVTVDLAAAEGLLQKVTCTPGKKSLEILASSGLLDLLIDLELDAILDFGLFQVPLVDAPLVVSTTRAQPAQTITLEVVDEQYTASVSTGDGSLGVPNLLVDTSGLTVLGIPLGTVTDWIVSPLLSMVLNPLVQALDTMLLSPLLEALGVNIAGADYKAVPKADCGIPVLRG